MGMKHNKYYGFKMRKRWFLIGMILMILLLPWLTTGCLVAQEDYDAVVAQLGTVQQEFQTVKSDLEAAQAKSSELASNLGKTETELEATATFLSNSLGSLHLPCYIQAMC